MKKIVVYSACIFIISVLIIIYGSYNDFHHLGFIYIVNFFVYITSLYLRNLSMLGGLYNIISNLLYVIISISPLYILIRLYIKKKVSIIDYIFLPIISIYLFILIYYTINPSLIKVLLPVTFENISYQELKNVIDIILLSSSFSFYILIVLYLFLKEIYTKKIDTSSLLSLVSHILIIIIAISSALQLNIPLIVLSIPTIYDIIIFIINSLFTLSILFLSIKLIISFIDLNKTITNSKMDFEIIKAKTKESSKLSIYVIILNLLKALIVNIVVLVLLKYNFNASFSYNLPIDFLVIASIIFMFSKYVENTKMIHEENMLTI